MDIDGSMIAEIRIEILENGSMNVTGPIHDKEWCYLALDMAKDTIRNFKNVNRIIEVPPDYVDAKIIKLKSL